jgi:phage portal protein BeeE/intein/homing endonuclease
MGALPLHVIEGMPDGSKRKAIDNPVYNLLHRAPNPEISAFTYRQMQMVNLAMYGNFYSEIETDDRGFPVALWPIPATNCEPARSENKELFYQVNINGEKRNVPAYRMLHFMGMGKDGMKGLSPIRQMAETIGISIAAEQFGASFFGSGANVGAIVNHPGHLTVEGSSKLENSLNKNYTGLGIAHRIMLLEEGMKFEKSGIPPNEAQFLETRQFQIEDVARIYGVQLHKIGHLLHATFCLPGDSQIFTEYGNKPIKDISVGEKVWSRDGDNWVLSPVEASAFSGIDEILEIKTGIRTLRANSKHHVPVRRKVMRNYRGGRGKYSVIDGHRMRPSYEIQWIPAGDIRIGDELLTLNGLPDTGSIISPTRECSPAFMESLGMIVGDGFFAKDARTKRTITFGLSHGEHDSQLPHYIEAIESEFRACDAPYGMKNGGSTTLKSKNRDKNTTVFHSTLACAELKECGVYGTAKTKRVPEWVFGLSDNLKLAFLRGYLDSDGTVNKAGAIRYVSVNKELLEDVRHLCMSVGVRTGNLFYDDIDSDFGKGKTYKHRLYSFICSHAEDNMRISSYSAMHMDRIQTICKNRQKRNVPIYPYEAKRRAVEIGIAYSKVVSIQKEPVAVPVYDLSVAGTHNFIADGVLVRNSNIEHQAIEFVTDTMLPWTVNCEMEYDRKLFPSVPRFYTKHSLEGLLRGDTAARAAFYTALFYLSSITPNEIRDKEDMNPLPDGNRTFVQSNLVPSDKIDQYIAKNNGSQPSRNLNDAVKRIVDRNKENLLRQYKANPEKFSEWLESYSRDFPAYMIRELLETEK